MGNKGLHLISQESYDGEEVMLPFLEVLPRILRSIVLTMLLIADRGAIRVAKKNHT